MAMLVGLVLTVIVEWLNSGSKSRFPLIDYLMKGTRGDKPVMARCQVVLELRYRWIAVGNRQCAKGCFDVGRL